MSGEVAARALQKRFEEIRRAELERLKRKLASLAPDHRVVVDTVTAQIVGAILREPAAALVRHNEPPLVQAVVDLFGVAQ